MKQKIIFLVLFMAAGVFGFSQRQKSDYKFHSINSLAFLNGESEVSAGLQSVNGFQKGNWFAGIGLGLDYYIQRSVPLFADVRYQFGNKKNKFFVYADAGANLEWAEDFRDVFIWDGSNVNSEFKNGVYTDAGLGYIVTMKKGGGLVLSLGHSLKTLKELSAYQDWRSQEWVTDIYRYRLNRIVLKVGWRF
jgi:hypothetical protein